MTFALGARAADYVFMYNNYFLGSNTTKPTTTFVPNASIYTGNSGSTFRNANKYYIRYNDGLAFSTTTGTNFTINNNNLIYIERIMFWETSYYLSMQNANNNNRTWQLTTSTDNLATAYSVTTETHITNFTISGDESISTTGINDSYTHTYAEYCDKYSFNDRTYYSTDPANAASTDVTTLVLPQLTEGYTWSISNNSYATVNPSTGAITVNSLPTTDTRITLTCSVTHNGKTQTVNKEITIIAPKIEPTSIIAQDLTLAVDDTGTIIYDLQPSGAYRNVTFSVADATIATVNANGVVTGIKAGTTTVTLTAKKLNGETSPALTTTINVKIVGRCATPIITIDNTTGNTTITCSTEDATIYYTTDGSDPTTSSTVYNGPFTVTKGTVVKAMATKSDFINSAIASQKNEIAGPTGVSDGVVTLNDLEDHNWTYYSGVDASVDEGNYNTNYAGKLYSPNPRNVKITYNGNGGVVSRDTDEGQGTFVYYKTLEQGSTSGQYPYTVISNPFSKRPSGKGFGGWEIVSGGEYIDGYDNGSTLPLDQEITFVKLPYPSANCISAEIVLKATWVNLNNKTYASGNTFTYSVSGGTYETNFLVLNRNVTGTITVSSPCTIMMVEPDGTDTDYRNSYTFSGNITPNNTGVTKIEYAKWNPNGNINATGRNVTLGRGLTMGGTGRTIYGTNSNLNINQVFKIESGTYSTFYAIGSSGPTNNMTKQLIILGNDYDRANNGGDNSKLSITNNMYLLGKSSTIGTDKLKIIAKSGKFTPNLDHSTAQASSNCFYLWHNEGGGSGTRELVIEGGEFWHIAGGWDSGNSNNSVNLKIRMKGGTIHGSVYGGAARYDTNGYKQFIFTGGTVEGWIAGGSNGYLAEGTNNQYGTVTGRSYVYVGGRTQVSSDNSTTAINMSVGGNVYGAGCGNTTVNNSGRVTEQTNVVIADECYVQRGVYGGGAYGSSPGTANVYITGNAHVGGVYENTFDVYGGVYGGARAKGGGSTNIYMTGGYVEHGVYGGSNLTGTISNNVTMQINGGQVGTSGTPANIHGGGYGQATQVSGNVEVTLGTEKQATGGVTVYGDVYGGSALGTVNSDANDHTYVTMHKGTINGSLYGGGLGSTSVAANVNGPVKVEVHGGSVKATSAAGSGGVYGANNINGAPQRSVTVDIYGTDPAPAEGQYALHAVYGGGNQAPYTYAGGPTVTVHNCGNSIEYIYGGGKAADVAAANVTIYGGNVIGNVFGGGHGTDEVGANVIGAANTNILGGKILNVYGGSNNKGTIGTINLNVNSQAETGKELCTMNIGNVFGGGNKAASQVGNISIGCTGDGGRIDNVYGGANQADITGNIDLKINAGNIGNVFGGNNLSGDINGTIAVTVGDAPITCGEFKIDNVYGAGNLAGYTGSPIVKIQSGTVTGNVFGGGLGSTATVTGNPQVTIGDNIVEHQATIGGDVYGGGDAASVVGIPVVNVVNKCNTQIGNVYGGGNAADVNGTDVNIDGGTITGMVFGGGHGDKTAEIAANVNGKVNLDITGGTINKVFGGSNSMGNITGSIALKIQKVDGHCDMRIAEVYGGGNEADGNAGSLTIGCTGALVEGDNGHLAHPEKIGKELEGIGAVYGGANNANIGNDVTLNINSGMVAKVFGGNNTGGTVNGNVTVNVNKSANTCGWYVGKVHGGGYGKETNVAKDVTVNIENGTIYGDVYGGSALGKVNTDINNTTIVNLTGGLIKGDAYGGGLGDSTTEADVNGNVTVTLNGTAFELTTIKDDNGNTIPTSGRIFGCNNINGSPKGTVLVKVLNTVAKDSDGTTKAKPTKGYGTYELQAVYGGGNLAAYEPENAEADGQFTSYTYNSNTVSHDNQKKPVQVVIDGCDETSIEYVYGGGNAASTPATDVLILGSYEIGNVFGGGNGKDRYTLDGTNWNANDGADVGIINAAAYDANKTEGKYGTGNAMTSVLGGTVNNIFGGSNTKGNIVGQATTRLDQATNCQLVVKDIYGGGNEAYMDGNTNIQLGCIEYLKEIYGGAKNADVGSDINMTITSGHFDRVFGGNNLGGAIKGSITLNIEETGCNPITIGEVYGGGNKAAYSVYGYNADGTYKDSGEKLYSDPVVNLRSFTSIGRVFGGGLGEEAVMVGSPTVNINEVVGANASNTSWPHLNKTINFNDGTASVTLPSHEAGKIGAIGTVFGGGNAAKVIGDTNVNIGTADDIIGVDIRGNIYGGGNQADVTGKTNVTIGK